MPPAAPTIKTYRASLIAEAQAMLAVMTPEEIAAAVMSDARFELKKNKRSGLTRVVLPLTTPPPTPKPAKRARPHRGPIPDRLGL